MGVELVKLLEKDIEGFLDDVPTSPSYRKLCADLLYPFKSWLADREFDKESVKRHAKARYEEPSSTNTFYAVAKSLAGWMIDRIPQDNVKTYIRERQKLELVKKIKRERVVKRVEKKGLTLEELERILRKLPLGSLEFSIIWSLHFFGCRPGELVALKPKMVDFKKRIVVFETEKTKVERELHFDEFTAEHLKRFLDAKPSYSYVYRISKEVGIVPKSGRQSFISHMQRSLSKAFDLVKLDILVKVASGHTVSSDITATYTDLPHDLERAFKEYHYLKSVEGSFRG